MSFRTLLVLLFVSTVVIAQVQLPSQPSPSLPETVVPGRLPVVANDKPMAPTSPTVAKQRPSGIRLVVSVPPPEGDLERTVFESVSDPSQDSNEDDRNNTAHRLPRTASRTVDGLVPFPRPPSLPWPVDHAETTQVARVARLTKELQRKQRQLDEIQAEITQLSQDIAAADNPQILVNVELFETVGDQFASFIALMSTKGEAPDDPTDTSDNMVVEPEAFRKILRGLAASGQLIALTRPKLITVSGRAARIEVGNADGGNAFAVTPKFKDGEWSLAAECEDRRDGRLRSYGMTVSCHEGEAIGFQMKLAQQFLIGLIHPEVVKPQATATSTTMETSHSATPLLPMPTWTPGTENAVREVQWLDLHLKSAPVLR